MQKVYQARLMRREKPIERGGGGERERGRERERERGGGRERRKLKQYRGRVRGWMEKRQRIKNKNFK